MLWDQVRHAITDRMISGGLAGPVVEDFLTRAHRVFAGETGLVDFQMVQDLCSDEVIELKGVPAPGLEDSSVREALRQTVIIRLNGGLGTTMGLDGPKTLLPVRDGMTFLDIILKQMKLLRQRSGVDVPLLFMNSFSTDRATLEYPGIRSVNSSLPSSFVQNRVPRLDAKTLLPIGDGSQADDWCPPGHGDIFLALQVSGLLDQLLSRGIRYGFIANGDNLGATLHPGILMALANRGLEFISEVTPKTPADIKGGVLFHHRQSNRIELLETAQVPPNHRRDFEDTSRFADFNINNLWIDLKALSERLAEGSLDLSLIVNPKKVRGQDVLQLECAMGAAIGRFQKTAIMCVPRSRFAPVKSCADLLVRRSDACMLDENAALVLHPDRRGVEPVVILDEAYRKVQDFERLVPVPPSLIRCRSLEVRGPVVFDHPMSIEGDVVLDYSQPVARNNPATTR